MKFNFYNIFWISISTSASFINSKIGGIWIGNTPKLFSERNGYTKSIKLPFGYRIKLLKGIK